MAPPFRVGLIGAGAVVRTLHAPLLRQFDDVSIDWVFDANLDAAREVAAAFGIPAASDDLARCRDVDAVLLAIPVGVRAGAWQAAVERRWHVLCEKPAATTRAELDACLSAMRQHSLVVRFGLMRRFYRGVVCLRDLVSRRLFGTPIEIFGGEGGPQPRTGRGDGWYQLDRRVAGGGILIETGSHLLDQLVFVTGACAAQLERYEQRNWNGGPEFDARVFGQLTPSADRRAVPFSAIVSRSAEVCNGIFIRCPDVVVALPPGPDAAVEVREESGRVVARVEGPAGATSSFVAFRDQWREFLTACRAADPADAVRDNALTRLSVGLIEDCYSS